MSSSMRIPHQPHHISHPRWGHRLIIRATGESLSWSRSCFPVVCLRIYSLWPIAHRPALHGTRVPYRTIPYRTASDCESDPHVLRGRTSSYLTTSTASHRARSSDLLLCAVHVTTAGASVSCRGIGAQSIGTAGWPTAACTWTGKAAQVLGHTATTVRSPAYFDPVSAGL